MAVPDEPHGGDGIDPAHGGTVAPAIQPTLRTGTEAAIAATLAYVGKGTYVGKGN